MANFWERACWRITGAEPRIPVHYFYAMLHEFQRGKVTQAQAAAAFTLDAADRTELLKLKAEVDAGRLTLEEIQEILMLAEGVIAPYTDVAAVKARFNIV